MVKDCQCGHLKRRPGLNFVHSDKRCDAITSRNECAFEFGICHLEAPRKHRSKLKRSASRIADSPMAAPVSRSISPPRTMTLKFFRSRRVLAIEIEFVAIVREGSGGISLAKARLVLPLSRNTVEASEIKARAAKAKVRFSFE
jgi:hypothetical protein